MPERVPMSEIEIITDGGRRRRGPQLGMVQRGGAPCARDNAYPPEALWADLAPVLNSLDQFRDRLGAPILRSGPITSLETA